MVKSLFTAIAIFISFSINANESSPLPSIPYVTNSIAFKTGDFIQLIEPKQVTRYVERIGKRVTYYAGNWFINAEKVTYVKANKGNKSGCVLGYFTGVEEQTIQVTRQSCDKVLFELSKAD